MQGWLTVRAVPRGVHLPASCPAVRGPVERYITDRFLPDKAIDLIDEACSDLNLRSKDISQLAELKKEDDFELERDAQEDTGGSRRAPGGASQQKLCRVAEEIEQLDQLLKGRSPVTMENLARIIELWTKIPASKIKAQEYEQLRQLSDRLKERIVGQDEAVEAVSRAIRRSRVGISPKKPVGFLHFRGPHWRGQDGAGEMPGRGDV